VNQVGEPLFSVANKVVFVSGGTRGIGRAIAEAFCVRGATVVVTSRSATDADAAASEIEQQARDAGASDASCLGMACDVLECSQIESAVDETLGACGQIDVLFNVAGVNRRKPAEELTEEDFDFVMDTNIRGAFFLSQCVGRHMLTRGSGSQINIASLNTYSPLHSMVPYAASKSALGHMTRALAMEWGPRGVRVNAIAPGFILSDFNRNIWQSSVMQHWGQSNTPMVRLGRPEDLVGASIFLASDASEFMTGQILFVDGGISAGIRWPIEQALQSQ
jgi:gluconate 5-dehydrogenase